MARGKTTLFVAGFGQSLRAKDLAYEFERWGPIVRCDIPAPKSNRSQPYAFIEFEDDRDAEDAFYEMHDRAIDGYRITVQWAKQAPRQERRSPPRHTSSRRGRSPSPRRPSHRSPRDDRSASPRPRNERSPSPERSGWKVDTEADARVSPLPARSTSPVNGQVEIVADPEAEAEASPRE